MNARDRRIRRRRNRWDEQSETTRSGTVLFAITTFSVASFLGSFAKATMMVPEAQFSLSIGLSLICLALTGYGSLLLWSAFARGGRRQTTAIVAAAAVVVAMIVLMVTHGALRRPMSEDFAPRPENPLGVTMPRVRTHVLIQSAETLVTIGEEGAVLDPNGAEGTLVVGSEQGGTGRGALAPEAFGVELRQVQEELNRTAKMLGRPPEESIAVSVDRCLPFEQMREHLDILESLKPSSHRARRHRQPARRRPPRASELRSRRMGR